MKLLSSLTRTFAFPLSTSSEALIIPAAALLLVFVGWSDVTVQNVAETYFLKRVGVDYLPLAFLASRFARGYDVRG